MKGAMVVTWTGIRPGRERLALKYGREVDDYWGTFAAEGKCTTPRWYIGQKGQGAWIVEGEVEDLLGISVIERAQQLTTEGPILLEHFTMEFCSTDRDAQFAMYEQVLEELQV